MGKPRKYLPVFLSATLMGLAVAMAGCEGEKGPGEKAGAAIDKGVQDAKDAVSPPGPAEKVGRAIDKPAG